MHSRRDFAELTMTPLSQWRDGELAYFHRAMSDLAAYLNAEGASLHARIIRELESRRTGERAADDRLEDTYPLIE